MIFRALVSLGGWLTQGGLTMSSIEHMLGQVLQKLVRLSARQLGMLHDLLEKLVGKNEDKWTDEFARFSREEEFWSYLQEYFQILEYICHNQKTGKNDRRPQPGNCISFFTQSSCIGMFEGLGGGKRLADGHLYVNCIHGPDDFKKFVEIVAKHFGLACGEPREEAHLIQIPFVEPSNNTR